MPWYIYVEDNHRHHIHMPETWIVRQTNDIRRGDGKGFTVLIDQPNLFMFYDYEDTRSGQPRLITYIKE